MLRIAVQSKGRLYEDTMALLAEADIKVRKSERSLLVRANDFPIEILYLRDDDIPQTVASGVADLGIVGENEFLERGENADIVKRLDFSKCRLSLAIPKAADYDGPQCVCIPHRCRHCRHTEHNRFQCGNKPCRNRDKLFPGVGKYKPHSD